MNTFVSVICTDDSLSDLCEKTITDVENKFSRTLSDSEISKLNNDEDFAPSQETLNVLQQSLDLSGNTDFSFSPVLVTRT